MRWLDRESVPAARRRLERWLDLRYVGQNFELLVPVPEETWRDGDCAALRRRFFETHEQVYGFAAEDEPVQVVNVRLVANPTIPANGGFYRAITVTAPPEDDKGSGGPAPLGHVRW